VRLFPPPPPPPPPPRNERIFYSVDPSHAVRPAIAPLELLTSCPVLIDAQDGQNSSKIRITPTDEQTSQIQHTLEPNRAQVPDLSHR
jgi:hypothetical protein